MQSLKMLYRRVQQSYQVMHPEVEFKTSPPPVILMVAPVFDDKVTAVFAPVFKDLDVPEKVIVPPPQFCTC